MHLRWLGMFFPLTTPQRRLQWLSDTLRGHSSWGGFEIRQFKGKFAVDPGAAGSGPCRSEIRDSCGHLIPQNLLRMTSVEEQGLSRCVIRIRHHPSQDLLVSGVLAGTVGVSWHGSDFDL